MNRTLQSRTSDHKDESLTVRNSGLLQRKCACGGDAGTCGPSGTCKRDPLSLQRSSLSAIGPSSAPPIVGDVLGSPGQPLDRTTRAFFEPRFGHDLSRVRIHNGAQAAESAQVIDALAYTAGSEVVFGAGRYQPNSSEGRLLLAHELAHVVQQETGMVGRSSTGPEVQTSEALERAADEAAESVLARDPAATLPVTPAGSQRDRAGAAGGPKIPSHSNVIMRYRSKGSPQFGVGDETGLKEESFHDAKKQPWIESIKVDFNGTKKDASNETLPTGTLTATYKGNAAKLPDITASIVGGAPSLGLTDKGTGFTVHRIEGMGYNDVVPTAPATGGPIAKGSHYSKKPDVASMGYAVFFRGKQAIHAGSMSEGSHSCVHVNWGNLHTIRQINYHSVEGITKVSVSYDSAALETPCCERMKLKGWMKKGQAPNPCSGIDPKAC